MSIIEKNLSKYQKIMRNKISPPDIQMKNLHEKKVDQRIISLIPSTHVSEINNIVDQIADSTGHTNSRVIEAIMRADEKHLILDEQKGKTFIKRNELY